MFLVNVIVPVVLIAGAGYLFARLVKFDLIPFTRLSFYILVPALIFQSMLGSSISGSVVAKVALFVLIVHGALLLLGALGMRFTKWDGNTKATALLAFTFSNCGNYGLPVLLFAFGDAGFALGVVYMVAHQVYQIVFGVGIASWRKGMAVRKVLWQVLTVPWLYAMVLALVVRATSLELPVAVARPIELVASAAIPVQLLLLGMALAQTRVGSLIRQAAPVSLAKLIVPPLLAWGASAALGLDGLLRAVLILEASTPTAVNALILSLQYDRRAELTASIILLTTLGGVATTTLLLWLLA
jgi:malate permease and related proteins